MKDMQTTTPVFVSSTFSDLQPYRDAVRDTLHRLEAVVRGMEYFGALPETPKDECLRIVGTCRIYVGIVAMRYGSIDPQTGKSFTHLEYEEAQRLGLPTLMYLLDEERQPVLPRNIDFGEAGERLGRFKDELKRRHVVSFFTSPEDLAVRVSQDLPALAERMGTSVHKGELARLVESLPRVDWLTAERFAFLKKEVGDAGTSVPSDDLLKEVLEFLLAGDRLAAVFLLSRRARLDLREATDTLMEIEKRVFSVVERGARVLSEQREAQLETGTPPSTK
jgi:hypothetical protein